jgi:hypothetical protein
MWQWEGFVVGFGFHGLKRWARDRDRREGEAIGGCEEGIEASCGVDIWAVSKGAEVSVKGKVARGLVGLVGRQEL